MVWVAVSVVVVKVLEMGVACSGLGAGTTGTGARAFLSECRLMLLDQRRQHVELLTTYHVLGEDREISRVRQPALPARLALRCFGQQPADDLLTVLVRIACRISVGDAVSQDWDSHSRLKSRTRVGLRLVVRAKGGRSHVCAPRKGEVHRL